MRILFGYAGKFVKGVVKKAEERCEFVPYRGVRGYMEDKGHVVDSDINYLGQLLI